MALFSPENQVSTGAHQVWGPCGATDYDLLGYPRARYLCRAQYPTWYFSVDCPSTLASKSSGGTGRWSHVLPSDDAALTTSWYTVCGQPHESWSVWMGAELVLASTGSVLFAGWAFATTNAKEGKPATRARKND